MSKVRYGLVAVAVLAFGGWGVTVCAAGGQRDADVRSGERGEDHYWDAMRFERDYRERVARLHRLHVLAERQHDSDRLADLEKLQDHLRAAHGERMAEIRRHMDDRAVARLDEALAEHREKADQQARRREHRRDETDEGRERASAGRPDRDRIRAEARDRAEQRWVEARAETGVKMHAAAHISHATSRLAEKRWREEARSRNNQRWKRAVRRSGILGDVPPSRIVDLPTQTELDAEAGQRISEMDADAEFDRLMKELEQ